MSNNNQNINTNNEYNTEAMPMDCVDDGASLYLSSEELSSADKGQGSASPKRIFEDSSVEREEDSKKSKKGQMDSSAAEDGLRRAALTNLMVQNQTKNGQTVQAVASASNEQAQPEKSARLVKGFQTAETMFVANNDLTALSSVVATQKAIKSDRSIFPSSLNLETAVHVCASSKEVVQVISLCDMVFAQESIEALNESLKKSIVDNLQNIENAVGELGMFSQFQLPRSLKTVCWAANCNSADMLAAKGIFIPMKPGTTRMLHACRNFVPINGCVHRLNVVDPRKNLGSAIDFVHSCNLSIITCCPKRGKGRTELAGGRIGSCHHQLVRQVGGRKWSRRA